MKIKHALVFAILLVAASAFTYQNLNTKETITTITPDHPASNWTDISSAVLNAKKDNKMILVDVYTDWCKWCKVMDKETFSDSDVSSFIGENFHLAKLNAEQKKTIQFKGKTYEFAKNGKRGYHELASELLNGQLAYPSLIVLDSQLNTLEVVRGFKKPKELMMILEAHVAKS
ncbi:MAG: DUF255 domain-containing protein [Saprospiraceae bacterium]|nr:DUF255 domain-containing protein [Saprospiraceae bacterium]